MSPSAPGIRTSRARRPSNQTAAGRVMRSVRSSIGAAPSTPAALRACAKVTSSTIGAGMSPSCRTTTTTSSPSCRTDWIEPSTDAVSHSQ